jgi:hypothetical protein
MRTIEDHRLYDRLTDVRKTYKEQGRILRRARHIYALVCRRSILADTSGYAIRIAAAHAIRAGLYAPGKPLKEARFGILRMIWKMEGGTYRSGYMDWHQWTMRNGFAAYSWLKKVA